MNFQYHKNIRNIAKTTYFISSSCPNRINACNTMNYPPPPAICKSTNYNNIIFSKLSIASCIQGAIVLYVCNYIINNIRFKILIFNH